MQKRLNLAPSLASAIARAPECRARADKLYAERAENCRMAMRECGLLNHPMIVSGRVEQVLQKRRALGVLYAYGTPDTVSVLRARYGSIVRRVMAFAPSAPMSMADAISKRETDATCATENEYYDSAAVALYLIAAYGHPLSQDETTANVCKAICDLEQLPKQRARIDTNLNQTDFPHRTHKTRMVITAPGESGIHAAFGNDAMPMLNAAELLGLNISDYIDDLSLSDQEWARVLWATDGRTALTYAQLAVFAYLCKAVAMDKKAILADWRETQIADAEAAKRESESARLSAAAFEARSAEANARAVEIEKRLAKAEAEIEAAKSDRAEIAALRNALWNLSRDAEPESFPAFEPRTIPAGTISIGGSDAWRAGMAEAVPDVRFIGASQTVSDPELRSAPEIWLQVSALPHSLFYRVADAARAYGVPLRYFSAYGIKRCASEMRKPKT